MNSNGYGQNPQNSNGYMNQQNGYGVPNAGAPYPSVAPQYPQGQQPYGQQPFLGQARVNGQQSFPGQAQPYGSQSIPEQRPFPPAQPYGQSLQPEDLPNNATYPNPQPAAKPKPNKVAMALSYVISGVGSILLLVSVVLFCVFMVPQLFGIKPYAVLSGSMEPEYPVGSLVFVQDANADQLEVGDVITFDQTIVGQGSTVVTHRIAQKDTANRQFVTKGDANETNDPERVPYASVIGKVVFSIPVVGYMALTMDAFNGKVAMIAVIVGAMILCLVGDQIRRHAKKAARKKVALEQPQ